MLICDKCKEAGHSLGYAERLSKRYYAAYHKAINSSDYKTADSLKKDYPCEGLCYAVSEHRKLWIARNADSSLYLFQGLDEPRLVNGTFFIDETESMMKLNPFSFPSVTHNNSPQKIDLCWLDKMIEDK